MHPAGWRVVCCFMSELPGVFHHENEVDVAVYGGADSTVVVDKLLFGHLLIRGQILQPDDSQNQTSVNQEFD